MKIESKEDPIYQRDDMEIKTPQELEEAKKMAGVTTHKKAMSRAIEHGEKTMDLGLYTKASAEMSEEELATERKIILKILNFLKGQHLAYKYKGEDLEITSADELEEAKKMSQSKDMGKLPNADDFFESILGYALDTKDEALLKNASKELRDTSESFENQSFYEKSLSLNEKLLKYLETWEDQKSISIPELKSIITEIQNKVRQKAVLQNKLGFSNDEVHRVLDAPNREERIKNFSNLIRNIQKNERIESSIFRVLGSTSPNIVGNSLRDYFGDRNPGTSFPGYEYSFTWAKIEKSFIEPWACVFSISIGIKKKYDNDPACKYFEKEQQVIVAYDGNSMILNELRELYCSLCEQYNFEPHPHLVWFKRGYEPKAKLAGLDRNKHGIVIETMSGRTKFIRNFSK